MQHRMGLFEKTIAPLTPFTGRNKCSYFTIHSLAPIKARTDFIQSFIPSKVATYMHIMHACRPLLAMHVDVTKPTNVLKPQIKPSGFTMHMHIIHAKYIQQNTAY